MMTQCHKPMANAGESAKGPSASARRRIVVLAFVMMGICVLVMSITTVILYHYEMRQMREMLQVSAQSQARMVEAIARNQIAEAPALRNDDSSYDEFDATLEQTIEAHELYAGFGDTGEFTLAHRSGDLIVFVLRHRHSMVERPEPIPFDSGLAEPMRRALEGESGTMVGLDYRGETVLAAYEPVAVLDFGIVSKIDLSEVRGPFIRTCVVVGVVALIFVVAGVALFWRIGAPIVARMELYARDLERENEERRASESFLERVMQRSPFAMWIADESGLVIKANQALYEILKQPEENVVGRYNILNDENIKKQGLMEQVQAVFVQQKACRFSLRWRGEDAGNADLNAAQEVMVDASLFPIVDASGELTNVVCQWVDITDLRMAQEELEMHHRQLENLVKERTDQLAVRVAEAEELNSAMANVLEDLRVSNVQLEATGQALQVTNRELNAFSYSVSHDLRAPLRHIEGFVQLLLKRKREQLDASSVHYLDAIKESADRMGCLIDDLLALSRTGRKELHFVPVDSNELVIEARRELDSQQEGRRIEWTIGALPLVMADRGLLRQVWSNLLSNAIKYTRPREEGHIEIGVKNGEASEHHEYTFYIRDNGVGFNPEYAHKLFGVFQRLHRDEDFEGSGIGLATVQRIVKRHNGRVWAEGATGQGATFYFTIPKMDRNELK